VIWLLKLYPRPWRRRYGDEVAAIVAERPFSIALIVDLIAGAVDVWLHPDVTMATAMAASAGAPKHPGGKNMTTRVLRFECAGGFTRREQWQSAAAAIGGTVVLSLAWLWLHVRIGDNAYVNALSVMSYLIPILASMRFTYLRGRPFSVYLGFVVTVTASVAIALAILGWLSSLL
jgi:hypothetical protein